MERKGNLFISFRIRELYLIRREWISKNNLFFNELKDSLI